MRVRVPTLDELEYRMDMWREELVTNRCHQAHLAQRAIEQIQGMIERKEYRYVESEGET